MQWFIGLYFISVCRCCRAIMRTRIRLLYFDILILLHNQYYYLNPDAVSLSSTKHCTVYRVIRTDHLQDNSCFKDFPRLTRVFMWKSDGILPAVVFQNKRTLNAITETEVRQEKYLYNDLLAVDAALKSSSAVIFFSFLLLYFLLLVFWELSLFECPLRFCLRVFWACVWPVVVVLWWHFCMRVMMMKMKIYGASSVF